LPPGRDSSIGSRFRSRVGLGHRDRSCHQKTAYQAGRRTTFEDSIASTFASVSCPQRAERWAADQPVCDLHRRADCPMRGSGSSSCLGNRHAVLIRHPFGARTPDGCLSFAAGTGAGRPPERRIPASLVARERADEALRARPRRRDARRQRCPKWSRVSCSTSRSPGQRQRELPSATGVPS
jgi:hypothetical protein